jgi:hypothetical protein
VYFFFLKGTTKKFCSVFNENKIRDRLEDFVIKKEIKSEIDGAVLSRKVFYQLFTVR